MASIKKKEWRKPEVKRIVAGAAEFGVDLNVDDADQDSATKDS